MSRHLYSGNLNAFKGACIALRELGFEVLHYEFNDHMRMQSGLRVTVVDSRRTIYGEETFTNWDADVLYNMATSWLSNLHDQLKTWS